MEDMMPRLYWTGIGQNRIMVLGDKKRSMKVVIMTHFTRMQQIDEYPALLNMIEDYEYSLGYITDHDLSYVPLNWKRYMETSVNGMRADMGTKL